MTSDGEYLPISGNVGALGRSDFRSLVKPGKADMISRQHLRVEYENDEYYIEDGSSTNGTRVNGSGITGKGRHLLKDGDVIDLGGALTLTFKS
jgi:pSer/pThr/pTyr-binding forkhead associated (FHA) protein